MMELPTAMFWSFIGAWLWVTFERISRGNDPRKCPTKSTYLFALVIGLLAGALDYQFRTLLGPSPVPVLILLGYVMTDFINSLFVIIARKRL